MVGCGASPADGSHGGDDAIDIRAGDRRARLGTTLAVIAAPSPRLLVDPPVAAPLPPTLAQRRRDRARAVARSAIPVAILLIALVPRLWATDLTGFGQREAMALAHARASIADPAEWSFANAINRMARGDWQPPTLGTLLHGAVLAVTDRVWLWISILGCLDAIAGLLVCLAARRLYGDIAAAFAGVLYAGSPWAWSAARDAAPSVFPALVAAALLASIRFADHPTSARAAALGVLVGLLVLSVPTGFVFLVPLAGIVLVRPPTTAVRLSLAIPVVVLIGPIAAARAWPSLSPADWSTTVGTFAVAAAGAPADAQLVDGALLNGGALEPALAVAVAGLMYGVGCAVTATRWVRGRRPAFLVPLAWSLGPTMLLSLLAPEQAADQAAAILPPTFVLMGAAASNGRGVGRRMAATIAIGAVALLAAYSAVGVGSAIAHAYASSSLPVVTGDPYRPAAGSLDPSSSDARPATARFWQRLADAVLESAERVGSREVIVFMGDGPRIHDGAILASLVGERLVVRQLPTSQLSLPLEAELLYVLMPGAMTPPELERPASQLASAELAGPDETARVVSLRPRPATDWLARASPAHQASLADGSHLVGSIVRSADPHDGLLVELYWTRPRAWRSATDAARITVGVHAGGAVLETVQVALPSERAWRSDEILIQRVWLKAASLSAPTGEIWLSAEGLHGPANGRAGKDLRLFP